MYFNNSYSILDEIVSHTVRKGERTRIKVNYSLGRDTVHRMIAVSLKVSTRVARQEGLPGPTLQSNIDLNENFIHTIRGNH